MSIFGALMGEIDDDPFLGGHMRRMNNMMNSFFRDPFGDMLGRSMGSELMPFAGNSRDARGRELARYGQDDFGMGMSLMPMGFPNIRSMFSDMGNNPNCHSFSSSTVMTMTSGPDGRPQVYQASQTVKQGPGGVRETKKTVADSRTGVKKMSIGHHIHDRAHIIEREQNVYSGEQEERQDFINLEEEEAEDFNKEWETKSRHIKRGGNAIEYGRNGRRRASRTSPQLALPSTQASHHQYVFI
nr:myeloid leukemia factor [Halyomorpha halys]